MVEYESAQTDASFIGNRGIQSTGQPHTPELVAVTSGRKAAERAVAKK